MIVKTKVFILLLSVFRKDCINWKCHCQAENLTLQRKPGLPAQGKLHSGTMVKLRGDQVSPAFSSAGYQRCSVLYKLQPVSWYGCIVKYLYISLDITTYYLPCTTSVITLLKPQYLSYQSQTNDFPKIAPFPVF